MGMVFSSTLMVLFLVTWWRVTWHGSPRGTLMIWVVLMLAAAILTLIAEITRLTAVAVT